MAEKHLTEPPWKQLVTKHSLKDLGMQKALAAYAKLDSAKQLQETLDALKEISELALKLKKAAGAKDEILQYVEEIVKEVKKTIAPLETKLKAATAEVSAKPADAAKDEEEEKEQDEDEEEAKEAAEFKKDLKRQMTTALAQVKTLAPDPAQGKEVKPQLKFMAYLAGKSSAVIVSRKVGSGTKKLLPEIAGGAMGGKFVQGECIFEKNTHTFVLDTVPAGLAKKLAAALFTETGTKYKVRLRSADGSMELDSDTDVDPDAAVDTAKEMAAFVARFKALQPDIVKAAATKTPQGEEAKQHAAEAGARANAKDFAGANQLLDTAESLIKKALAAPSPKAAPAPPPTAPPKPAAGPKLSTYMNASRDWKAAKKTAADNMFALKNAILKECDPELKKTVEAKINDLSSIFSGLDDSIIEKIEAAGRESDEERQAELNQALAKFAGNMLTSFRSHRLANVVDNNPFGTYTIRAPVESVLTKFVADFGL